LDEHLKLLPVARAYREHNKPITPPNSIAAGPPLRIKLIGGGHSNAQPWSAYRLLSQSQHHTGTHTHWPLTTDCLSRNDPRLEAVIPRWPTVICLFSISIGSTLLPCFGQFVGASGNAAVVL